MSALLLYSLRCKHSITILNLIKKHKSLQAAITLHDINERGVPRQLMGKIDCVPVLVTKDGNIMSGKEVKNWINSTLPDNEEVSSFGFGGMGACVQELANPEENGNDIFSLDSYGSSLSPQMTPELQRKIDMNVSEAYNHAQAQ